MKKIYYIKFIFILFILFSTQIEKSWGQSKKIPHIPDQGLDDGTGSHVDFRNLSPDRIRIIPSSPQAQVFDQYLNHKIDESSGLPDINIPLYEIKVKGVTIPIVLTYHASGIKYRQFDSEVGAGWSIGATGYRVSRTIYGRVDNKNSFFDKNKHKKQMSDFQNDKFKLNAYLSRYALDPFASGGSGDLDLLANGGFGWHDLIDGEYDIFSYILPTTQSKFIISNRENSSVTNLLVSQDVINLKNATEIEITDKNGILYELGGLNGDYHETAPNSSGYTSWLLRKVTTPFSQHIDLKYSDINLNLMQTNLNQSTTIMAYPRGGYGDNDFIQFPSAEVNKNKTPNYKRVPFITQINTSLENIYFVRSDSSYLLKEILILSKTNKTIKKINFNYIVSGYHNLLESVVIEGGGKGCETFSFEYFPPSSAVPDQWGYYSGLSKIFDEDDDVWRDIILHKDFLDDKIECKYGKQLLRNVDVGKSSTFADRTNKLKHIPDSYSLKTIHFPTGGKTTYTYESNQYIDNGDTVYGGGLRTAKITSYTINDTITTLYKYGKNEDGNGVTNFNRNIQAKYFACERTHYTRQVVVNTMNGIYWLDQSLRTYYTQPYVSEFLDFGVSYEYVSKYQVNNKLENITGKILFQYDIPKKYTLSYVNLVHTDYGNEQVSNYNWGAMPNILSKKYFDKKNVLIKTENYSYNEKMLANFDGIKVYQPITSSWYSKTWELNNIYDNVPSFFSYLEYTLQSKIKLLKTKSTIINCGMLPITTTESYEYDSKNQIKKIDQNNSVYKQFAYPYDYKDFVYKCMASKNIVAPIVEKTVSVKNTEIARLKTSYYRDSIKTKGFIVPQKVEISTTGIPGLQIEESYDAYDRLGNLLQKTSKDGIITSYIWSYGEQYPIAEIQNATYSQIEATVGKFLLQVLSFMSASNMDTSEMFKKIDELREKLPEAQVTTYKYEPLIGMTEKTDPRGITTYYDYDSFGRLKETYVKENGQKRIVESYHYHYQYESNNNSSHSISNCKKVLEERLLDIETKYRSAQKNCGYNDNDIKIPSQKVQECLRGIEENYKRDKESAQNSYNNCINK